jgi:hypothetical protein
MEGQNKKHPVHLAALVSVLLVLVLLILNTIQLVSFERTLTKMKSKLDSVISSNIDDKETGALPTASSKKIEYFTGTLKKEEIPAELELGDYWYWLYLDKPQLIENSTGVGPLYTEKLEVYPPEHSLTNIDEYIDLEVEIAGYLDWGYSESRVIKTQDIAQK